MTKATRTSESPAAFSHAPDIQASFDGMISVASGSISAESDRWEAERLSQGLKLVVVGGGALACKLPNCQRADIVGPCVCAIWNQGESEGLQSFSPGHLVPYTAITVSDLAVRQHFADGVESFHETFGLADRAGPHLAVTAASRPVRALCAQIAACPLQGASRALYLSGKALEITAHSLACFETRSPAPALHLSTADIEKIHQAKKILADRLQTPPSLSELALETGLNVRKLKVGFQRIFGDSVYGYLQTLRLETAFRLLSDGEMSVSSTAYQVGYSPAHFSVAFRKRFGVTPSNLRSR